MVKLRCWRVRYKICGRNVMLKEYGWSDKEIESEESWRRCGLQSGFCKAEKAVALR